MLPYLIPVIFVFVVNILFLQNKRIYLKKKRVCSDGFALSLIVLFLFAAIRGNGSGDYFVYLNAGRNIKSFADIFHNNLHMDVAYCFLAWIVNFLHLPSQAVIALMNLVSIGSIGVLIKRYSNIPVLSVLIFLPFYFQFDMHAARTACAISVLTLAVPYILKRDLKKFLIILLLASLFHPEALVGIALYFLPSVYIDLKSSLMIILFILLISILKLPDQIIAFVLENLGFESIYGRFIAYAAKSDGPSKAARLYDPRLFLAFLVFLYAKISNIEHDRLGKFLVNSALVNVVLMIFFNQHAVFVYRLSPFYGIFSIVLLPVVFDRAGRRKLNAEIAGQYTKIRFLAVFLYTILSAAYAMEPSVPYTLFKIAYW